MLIATYDYQTQALEPLADISRTTALTIGPKWCHWKTDWLAGYNLYAVEGERAVLLETYETERDARWVRNSLVRALRAGQGLVIV